jgi:asparagine synthase (glutamine-hydrolysing)
MLVRNLGEPFADSSIVPTYHLARATRGYVTVVLTGDGGDESFGGYDRYRAGLVADHFGRLPWLVRRGIASAGRALRLAERHGGLASRAARLLSASELGVDAAYARWIGYFFDDELGRVAGERVRPCIRNLGGVSLTGSGADRFMAADVAAYLPGDLLVKMDIATMAASLEARSPLLDHELVEFVARLPDSHKVTLSRSKIVLRRAMRGRLPDVILRRRKRGFAAPVAGWLRGPLRDMVRDTLGASRAVDGGLLDSAATQRLLRDHLAEVADNSKVLWSLLMLELWVREVASSHQNNDRAGLGFVA